MENQNDIHHAMPVRVMSGDSANYHNQWRRIQKAHRDNKELCGAEYLSGFSKTDRLTPVSTIFVYWGDKPWDGPRCLKDILDLEGIPSDFQKLIADYPLNLIKVILLLTKENRIGDLVRAASDTVYQNQLFLEYGL